MPLERIQATPTPTIVFADSLNFLQLLIDNESIERRANNIP
jgi:hypothetical protein